MNHRFGFLDGVRGLAALSVALGHFFALFYVVPAFVHTPHVLERIMTAPLIRVLFNGEICVCIFFVLSGFVLSYKFFLDRPIDVGLTVSKRYFRLAVPVVASVLFACLFMKLGFLRNVQAAAISGDSWAASFYQFTPHFLGAAKQGLYGVFAGPNTPAVWYNPVLWTMKIELLGSLITFATAMVLRKTRNPIFIYLLLAVIFWQGFYLCFIVGIAFAQLFASERFKPLELTATRQIIATLGLAALIMLVDYYGLHPDLPLGSHLLGTNFLETLTASLIILWSLMIPVFRRVLSLRPIRFLGKISFALYVIHFIVYVTFSSCLYVLLYHAGLSHRDDFIVTFFISLPLILYLSYLYTVGIDVPSIRLSGIIGRFLSEPFKFEHFGTKLRSRAKSLLSRS